MFPCLFEQNVCPVYVRVRELVGVSEAEINVRLGCEMEYRVDVMFAQDSFDFGR